MKIKRHCLAALTLLGIILGQAAARADEGMWLIQDINSALEKKMPIILFLIYSTIFFPAAQPADRALPFTFCVDGKNSVDFTKSVPQIPNFREDT